MQVSIRLKNFDKAGRVFNRKSIELNKDLRSGLKKIGSKIISSASRKTPVDTGRLRSSLKSELSRIDNKVSVGTNVKYAEFVHGDGKKKRSKPHFPPISAIAPWARRHKLNPFVVARAISRKGTKLHPFLTDALEENERNAKKILSDIVENSVNEIASDIS